MFRLVRQIGLDRAGRSLDDFEIVSPVFIGSGATDELMAESVRGRREQVSFYGSTPAYRDVLDLHGWGDLSGELNALSKQGRWDDMIDAVPDEVLETFAIIGEPRSVAGTVAERYGDVIDRVFLHQDYEGDPDTWMPVVEGLSEL